jgi:hypothetical protein
MFVKFLFSKLVLFKRFNLKKELNIDLKKQVTCLFHIPTFTSFFSAELLNLLSLIGCKVCKLLRLKLFQPPAISMQKRMR